MKKTEVPIDKRMEKQLLEISHWSIFGSENLADVKDSLLSIGASMSLLAIIIWLLVAKLVAMFTHFNIGWNSDYRSAILVALILISFAYSLFEIIRSSKPSPELIAQVEKDLEKGVVDLISYEFKELKVFEEPEHGGFIYYLLTSDNEVLALFDAESQDLSIDGEDPKNSSYLPRKYFEMYKTKYSKMIIDEVFKGKLLEFPEIHVMSSDTSAWPEHGSLVLKKWVDI